MNFHAIIISCSLNWNLYVLQFYLFRNYTNNIFGFFRPFLSFIIQANAFNINAFFFCTDFFVQVFSGTVGGGQGRAQTRSFQP